MPPKSPPMGSVFTSGTSPLALSFMPHFSQWSVDFCILMPQVGQNTRVPSSFPRGCIPGISPLCWSSDGCSFTAASPFSSSSASGGTGVPHSMQN